MIFKNLTKKKIANSTILLLLIIFNLWFQVLWLPNIYINPKNKDDPFLNSDHLQTSETDYYNKEWITNGDFSFGSTNWSNTVTGDTSDVSMMISGGEASYTIEGETHIKEISDPINLATAPNWVAFNKSEPAINPDTCTIDNQGFYVSHSWWDATPDQFTTISWRYNVSMGVDMSDYVINSATFDAIMNATVNRNVDAPGDTYAEYDNWYVINQAGIYDHALFYIEIADMALDTVYRIAYNKTNDLGRYDTLPRVLSYSDKSIEPTGDEQDLMYYITSVLDKDPGHNEFAIIAGIEIQCEDDYTGIDKDDWTALRIKSINLTFSYDKKIEPLTKASYNQNGDLIPDYYEIKNATLNFKYKIDRDWTINTGSLNSEFRIIINNNQLGETVKLTTATSTYKSFKVGGVDVANFLTPNEEVNLSIQLYIGDEFTLDSDIIVSIDNVSLVIGYGIFTLPDASTYDLILNDIYRTIEKSGQVTFNEELNITFIYKNSLGDFISGATVELTGSGLPSLILDPDLTHDQYYTIINSTELGVGTSYLTLTASKRYHTTIEFQITITVVSRNTEIQLFLNGANETDTKEVSIPWNENLNITVRYLDIELGSNMHIDNAIMELTGAGAAKDLEEDVSNEQYELSINSNILGLGATYLTVYASKQNYSSLNIRFKVTVNLRTTYLDNVLLDGIESTSLEVEWNEMFDVSVSYNDSLTDNFIEDATVQLIGPTYSKMLTQSGQNKYNSSINSFDFTIGNNFLTILAQKDNYSIASRLITIIVAERGTSIQIELNKTETTTIYYAYNELLNITAVYEDSLGTFINNANVELIEGSNIIDTLLEDTYNQYSCIINTTKLGLNVNLLTVYAKKDNYSAAFASITIIIQERDTDLEITLNGNPINTLQIPYGETLNITAVYNDLTQGFISGATVELRNGTTPLYTLDKSPSYNQYTRTINTNQLILGVNILSVYAKKENYSAALVSIIITVIERETVLDIFLEGLPGISINIDYGESINITAVYKDSTGPYIDGAIVQLREGTTIVATLSWIPAYQQYYFSLNSSFLEIGTNLLAIYAKRVNYAVALESITVIVEERDTFLEPFLNGNPINTLQIPYGEILNITAVYNDLTEGFISGATVELRNGTTPLYTLDKSPSYNQYTRTINTNQLILGVNILSVYAKKENYSAALVSIIITVIERETVLDIFLEGLPGISINIDYGESINITAIYKDTTGVLLDNSVVELREGSTTKAILTWIPSYQQYYYSMDTSHLSLGTNLLAVYAKKQNYTAELLSITITVNERDTILNVLLEGLESSTIEFYNISVNEYLNITAIYNDFTDVFIDGATVQLTGSGETRPLSLHPTFYQYNITLKVEDLGIGVHFLVVSAEKENYSSSIVNIKLNVLERRASLQLFVDTVNNLTLSRYIAAEIDQILNISIFFRDFVDKSHLSGATVRLTGAINKNFTENLLYEHYNVSISSNNLGPGINFLTIFAQKDGYKSESIWFTIEVIEKNSNYQLFLNNINKTLDKSIEVTVGDLVNISIFYNDYSGLFIDDAEVVIIGEGISLNLTKHPLYNQYNVTINSNDLNFGINRLTLYAYKINYQPQTLIIVIEIVEKETDINIFLNGLDKTIDRTLSIPIRKLLNITINYFDFESGNPITGATIQVVGEGLLLNLTENPLNHRYSISIDTSLLDIGVRFLTVYCQRPNYQSYSALLRIQVDRIRTNVSTTTGETVVNLIPGDNYRLKIRLTDLDFNQSVLNATVSYTWAYGQGDLTDEDNDGVYEALLSNLPVGTFIVTISVYAGDDYEFERFQITMNIVSPPENVLLFQILTIAGIAAAIGVSGYLLAYQKILKYPKQVRKIHKFKSKLKKPKSLGVEVQSREQIIDKHYSEEITALEKQIKRKLGPKSETSNGNIEKTKEIELNEK